MREIALNDVGAGLKALLLEEDPLEADIGIMGRDGSLSAVVISPEAYSFLLRKLEEEEDRLDIAAADEFNMSGEKS